MKSQLDVRKVLVFRMGQLGDTIVALPAMWVIRENFPKASMTLLCDRHLDKKFVLAADLLRGTGLFDDFQYYDEHNSSSARVLRIPKMMRLLWSLRRQNFDTLVYLAPTIRTPEQVQRDRRFFGLAGIKQMIGMSGFYQLPTKTPGKPLASTPSEADLLLARLATDGVSIPAPGHGSLELKLGPDEKSEVDAWLDNERWRVSCPSEKGQGDGVPLPECDLREMSASRPWVGVGPGSKMPAKRWPEERFAEVVSNLIQEFDVWPVIFGGKEDKDVGDLLLRHWGRGFNAAGALSLRGAAAGLKRCLAYIGNDTGTMHLAAVVKTPCVAVFSARHAAGSWNPYGLGHQVFQTQIECEGCLLVECVEKNNECLRRITVEQITAACRDLLLLRESVRKQPVASISS